MSDESQSIHIVFEGCPTSEAGKCVGVESDAGAPICIGEWKQRLDGLWELVIPYATPQEAKLSDTDIKRIMDAIFEEKHRMAVQYYTEVMEGTMRMYNITSDVLKKQYPTTDRD